MKEIEIEGKTVTHAVEKGLAELGLRRDQVEVQVLQESTPGFLGLGTKLARVRIREKIWGEPHAPSPRAEPAVPTASISPRQSHQETGEPRREDSGTRHSSGHAPTRSAITPHPHAARDRSSGSVPARPVRIHTPSKTPAISGSQPSPIHQAPPDTEKACAEAKAVLDELLLLLKIEHPNVIVSWDAKQVRVRAEVETPDTRVLVGKDGHALESLQFLVTLMLSRRMNSPVAVQVECAGYWQEKEESILLQAHQAMEMVQRTQRPVRLKPMDACMRRLIHRTLAQHPEFETASEGEGVWRKVVIKPKKK